MNDTIISIEVYFCLDVLANVINKNGSQHGGLLIQEKSDLRPPVWTHTGFDAPVGLLLSLYTGLEIEPKRAVTLLHIFPKVVVNLTKCCCLKSRTAKLRMLEDGKGCHWQ